MAAKEMSLDDVVNHVIERITKSPEVLSAPIEARAAVVAKKFNDLIAEEVRKAKEELTTEFQTQRDADVEAMEELRGRLLRAETFRGQDHGLRRMANGQYRPEVSRECAQHVADAVKASLYGQRANSSGVASEGGVTIAPEYSAEIIRLIPTVGVYRRLCRSIPMTSNTLNFGKLLSGMTVSWPEENAKITRSYPSFGPVTLTAKLMAAMTEAPRTLLADSSVALGNLYIDLMIEAMGGEEDLQGFIAQVADPNPFTGILYATGVVPVVEEGVTSILNSDVFTLLKLQTAVPDGARENCLYIMNPTTLDHYRAQRTTDGAPVVNPPTASAPGTIFGRPYEVTEKIPGTANTGTGKRHVLYGNPKYLLLGDREEITVERSQTAGEAFERHQEYFKATERIAVGQYGAAFAVLEMD